MTRIAIIGASGRMGRALVRAVTESSDFIIASAVASADSPAIGRDVGELAGLEAIDIPVCSDLPGALSGADVAVDFSTAQAARSNLAVCRERRKPLLIGTTGIGAGLDGAFEEAAQEIALLVAPNTSLGMTLLTELVRTAARALPSQFDIEIIEAHHRTKRDAPSGTALALGAAAAEARGQPFEPRSHLGAGAESVPAERREGEIGIAVVRGGDLVGEHTVVFAGTGERLCLSHQATDRAVFARGALRAAAWLALQPRGRYFMRDIVLSKSTS